MTGALSHLTVAELCDDVPGASCGRQFAAWGAEVTVIEPPGGSALRRAAPRLTTGSVGDLSLMWEYLAAGKASIAIGTGDEPAVTSVRELLARADVFITDWSPDRLSRAGILPETTPARTVVVSLSPFGREGPYAGFAATDLVLQALSGFMVLNGLPDREPLKAAGSMVPQAIGVNAFVGALAALLERDRSGRGQVIDISCFEALTTLTPLLRAEYSGVDDLRQGAPISGTFMFECRDGYISLNPMVPRNWEDLLVALGVDGAYLPDEMRGPNLDPSAVRTFVTERVRPHSARDLFAVLNELRIPCGVANGPIDLLSLGHLAERGFFFELDHPRLGAIRFPGPPGRMSVTPMAAPAPAPAHPGERRGPSAAAGRPRLDPPPMAAAAREPTEPPLTGVRVVDLTSAWLGPYASMLLADLGADVLKIEAPLRPDGWRGANVPQRPPSPDGTPPRWASHPVNPDAHPWNVNSNFNSVNRNKRDIALDLTDREGKELFLRLIKDADIVLENFTPRVMNNFGLSFDVLRQVNPRLVMISFSGFGNFGPFRDYRANGATTDTTCGWSALTGYRDGPPTMMGAMEADPTTGLHMAATALTALTYARRTGIGQHVDGSMLESCVGYIGEELLHAAVTGANPPRDGNRHRDMVPHGVFPSAGDDDWLAIAVRDDRDWDALVSLAGDEAGLRDPRFATGDSRLRHADDIEARLSRWTKARSAHEAMLTLQAAGIPAGAVQNYLRVLEDPQLVARRWFQPITHPDMGRHRYNGFPWRFSRTPPVIHKPPPRVGEDSRSVLRDDLRLAEPEIDALLSRGVARYVEARE